MTHPESSRDRRANPFPLCLLLLAFAVTAGTGCSVIVETGSLSVRLHYGDNSVIRASDPEGPRTGVRSPYVHADNNVIVIRVLAPHISPPMEGTFRRSAGRGEISGVPAGDRIAVEVDEYDASGTSLLGRGWTQGVSLSPGQRRDVTVTMYARGDIVRVCGADNTLGPGGDPGETGDGGLATNAKLSQPLTVKAGPDDSIFVSSSFNGNHRIRKIDRYGYISHVAGAGPHGAFLDNQDAATAPLGEIFDIDLDTSGNIYLINWWQEIVKVDSVTGKISIKYGGQPFNSLAKPDIAVVSGTAIFYSNGVDNCIYEVISGVRTSFVDSVNGTDNLSRHSYVSRYPASVSYSPQASKLLFADKNNSFIKSVSFFDSKVYTEVPPPTPFPVVVEADPYSLKVLYIEEGTNQVWIKDDSGAVRLLAGTGLGGYSGDGSTAINARLNDPHAVAVDSRGNVYIADTGNNALRVVIGGALP